MSQLYLTGAALAKKPTITTVATGYNATDTVNDNFTNIRNAFDNTLSLDGSTPNAMEADLDLNGHDILNGGTLYVDNIIYGSEPLPILNGGTGATTASGARTNLGLGTMATQSSSNYLTTSTASSTYLTQSNAASTYLTQTNAASTYLTQTNAASTYLTQTNASSTYLTQTNASSTYLTQTSASSTYLTQTSAASTYQPLDSDLTALGGLSKTDGNFIVGDGSTWVAESGATARASLGLGTAATQASSAFATAAQGILADSATQPGDLATVATTGAYSDLTGIPSTFTPASHTHIASAVTDFSEAVDDRVNGLLVAGTGITLTYNDLGNTLTIASSFSGTGNVTGPASATANNFASFDGITGKVIKDSTYSASSFAAAVHTHAISDVTNLQTTLDGKQPLDADLTAIAGLSGTSGFLKKTAANTWSLDTSTYLTTSSAASTYQPLDSDLTAIAALANTDSNFIVGNGTTWVAESGATARASLGLGTMATETASNYLTTASAASTYQPLDSDLTTLGGLAKTDGNFIVGDGTNWVVESGSTARTSLGLGTISTQASSNVSITGGSATGLSTVTTTGDVGIYTSSPEYRLDITAADNVTTTTAVSVQNSSRNYGLGLGAYQLTNRNIGGTATTVDFTFDIGGAAIFKTANSERMQINNAGYVAINTTPQSYAQLRMKNDRTATTYGYVLDTHNGATFENSYVQGFDGSRTFLGNYQSFPLTFLVNNTESMRIETSGNVDIGRTSTVTTSSSTDVGHTIASSGHAIHFRDSNHALSIGRQTNDGDLVRFFQAGTQEGAISVSGTTVTYGSFSGSHWSQLSDNSKPDILPGTVVETIDEKCEWSGEENDQLAKFKVSDTVASKRVYGVFMSWDNDDEDFNDAYITGLGAYIIRISAGVNVNGGDLLESNGNGCARVQADDLIRSSTIAKVTCNIPTQTYEDGSYTVPCVLYCG